MSPLDQAVAALADAPEDEALTRALYATLAGSELYLLLEEEAQGDRIKPTVFPLETGSVVLGFDSEERLSDFAGSAPFAALSGRALATMLGGQGIGLGLNLGTGSEHFLPPEVLSWLADAAVTPTESAGQPVAVHAPEGLPDTLLSQIEARLAAMAGLATQVVFAQVEYADTARRPLIAFLDPAPGAQEPLAASIGEALAILGTDPSEFDLTFVASDSAAARRLLAAGLAIDLPEPQVEILPSPPGTNPDRPPKLR